MISTDRRTTLNQLFPLLLVIFLDTVGYFIVIPVTIHIFIHNDAHLLSPSITVFQRDLLFSITLMLSPLAFIICSPLLGHLSDRIGRKPTLIVALIIACIGFLLPIIGITKKIISLILIGRFIAGVSSSSQPIAQASITDFTADKQRAFYLALIGAAMTIGMVIGPLTSSLLSLESVTTPYWLAFWLSIINLLLLIILYKNPVDHQSAQRSNSTTTKRFPYYLQLLKQNKIWLLLIAFFFYESAWAQYYQASFLLLDQYFHYTVLKVSIFTTYVGIWMALGLTVIYKYLIQRHSVETILKYSLLIMFVALALCIIPSTIAQWILMIPATICIGTAYPSLLHMLSHRCDNQNQGYVLGFASTALGIAWMVTGLVAGPAIASWAMIPNIISASCAGAVLIIMLWWGNL